MLTANKGQGDPLADVLISANRSKFHKAFTKHCLLPDGKIPPQEFVQFCKNVKLLPDLIQWTDLKRILHPFTAGLSYKNFEAAIKLVASNSFNTNASLSEKLRMLLMHIRNAFQMHYNTSITLQVRKTSVNDSESSNTSEVKPTARKKSARHSRRIKKHTRELSSPSHRHQTSSFFSSVSNSFTQKTNSFIDSKNYAQTMEHRSGYATPDIPKPPLRRNQITRIFDKFRQSHQLIHCAGRGAPNSKQVVDKQRQFICSIRKSMMGKDFVLGLLFRAWAAQVKLRV